MNKWFTTFATKVSVITGRSYTFALALAIILIWAITGPFMKFSDTWQLVINTLTTLITFLMVFIIQNSQNRSNNAEQIKLDFILELLGVDDEAVRNLENMNDKELDELLEEVQKGKQKAHGKSNKAREKS